jgi:phosphate transport system permease protein
MSSLKYRLFKNKLLTLSVVIFSALTAVPLVLIIGKVFLKGWRQINWDFFTKTTPTTLDALLAINNNQPIPGGIANGIVGTLMMVLVASVIAIPLGGDVRHLSFREPKNQILDRGSFPDRLIAGYSLYYFGYNCLSLGGYSP